MRLLSPFLAIFACFFWVVSVFPQAAAPIESDICVFGGTSAGVVAAVQAARSGQKVVLTGFGAHLGGMTSGGLSQTDIGNKAAIGGIAREFYQRMGRHYGTNEVWKLEPHVAEDVFNDMIRESGVPVYLHARLAKVSKTKRRITEITMEDGRVFRAKMFIDASYEGDLMAESGVSYFVGREANSTYHETLDGIRAETPKHQFLVSVDPYVQPGNPASGLLPWVQFAPKPLKEKYDYSIGSGPSINPHWGNVPGDGDNSIQAYNFRLCLTRSPTNWLPIEPPANYDPAQYELLGRYIEGLVASSNKITLHNFMDIHPMPNGKTDVNNNGGFSTDFIGQNYLYPDGSYAEREKIWKAHEDYTRGFLHFLATDSRVPESIRADMRSWGLCKDEFQDTGGWPNQLYIREGRRMISDYVMTETNCRNSSKFPIPSASPPIPWIHTTAAASFAMAMRRIAGVGRGGCAGRRLLPPYQISYAALRPRAKECDNLLVPVCLSASHIAYGSIRMEPVFMVLGQSAAMAASLAIEKNVTVQNIEYPELRRRLLAADQILEWQPAQKPR